MIGAKKVLYSQSINIIISPFVNTPFHNLLFYSKTLFLWEIMLIAEDALKANGWFSGSANPSCWVLSIPFLHILIPWWGTGEPVRSPSILFSPAGEEGLPGQTDLYPPIHFSSSLCLALPAGLLAGWHKRCSLSHPDKAAERMTSLQAPPCAVEEAASGVFVPGHLHPRAEASVIYWTESQYILWNLGKLSFHPPR